MNFQNWNNGVGRRMGNGRMRNRGNRGRNGRPWRGNFQPRYGNSWLNPRHQGYFNGPVNHMYPPEGVQNFYNQQHRQFLSPPPLRKPPSRPQSPLPGSEEYTQRNIQQASELIKRQLNVDCSASIIDRGSAVRGVSSVEVNKNSKTEESNLDSELVHKVVNNRKIKVPKPKQVSEFDVKEIHKKIVSHISNLSHGRKVNLVNKASSGYDEVIQRIQKQKRLELSRVLRDMCKRKIEEKDNKVIDAIVPDMGIKIEDFPSEVISQLSTILGVDFDEKIQNSAIDPEKSLLQGEELLTDDDYTSFEGLIENQENSQPSSSNSNYFPQFSLKPDENFTLDFTCSFSPPPTINQIQPKKVKLKWSPFNKPKEIDENKNSSNMNFWHKPSVYEPEDEELDYNCEISPVTIEETPTTTDKLMEMSLNNLQFTIENSNIKIPDLNLDLSKLSSPNYQVSLQELDSPAVEKEIAAITEEQNIFPAIPEEASEAISTPESSNSSIKAPQSIKIDSPAKETDDNYYKSDDLIGYISTNESSFSRSESTQINNEISPKIDEDSFLLSKSSFEDFEVCKEVVPNDLIQNGTVESKAFILEKIEIVDSEIKLEKADYKVPATDTIVSKELKSCDVKSNSGKIEEIEIEIENKHSSSTSKTKESRDKRHHDKKREVRHDKRETKERKHNEKHKQRRHESKQKRIVSSYTQYDPDIVKRANRSSQTTGNHQKNSISTQVFLDCFEKTKHKHQATQVLLDCMEKTKTKHQTTQVFLDSFEKTKLKHQATQVSQDGFEKVKLKHQATQVSDDCFEKIKLDPVAQRRNIVERLRNIDDQIRLLLKQKENIYEELASTDNNLLRNKTVVANNFVVVPNKRKSPVPSISRHFANRTPPHKTKSLDNLSAAATNSGVNAGNNTKSPKKNTLNINIPLESINEFSRDEVPPSTSSKSSDKTELDKIGIKMSFKRTKKPTESDNLVQQTIDYVVKKFTTEDTNRLWVETPKEEANEWCVSKINLDDRKQTHKRPHSDSDETKAIHTMPTKASKKFFKTDTEDVYVNRQNNTSKKRLKVLLDDSDSDTNSTRKSTDTIKSCSVSLRRYNIADLNDIKVRLQRKKLETNESDSQSDDLEKMTTSSTTSYSSPLHNYDSVVDNVSDHVIVSDQGNDDIVCEKDFYDFVGSILVVKVVESIILAASDLGKIYYFNLDTGDLLHVINVSNKAITSVCMVKNDPESIFVGSLDGMLNVLNFNTKEISKSVQIEDGIQCMEYCWDYIFIGSPKGFIIRYAVKTGKIEDSVKVAESNVLVIKAAPEGARRILLVASRKAPVSIRDAMSGLLMREFDPKIFPTVYTLLLENNLVYCGTSQHDILVYRFQNGELMYRHEATNSKGVACMKIVGNLLFAGCYNGKIYVYNLKSKVYLGTMDGPGGLLLCMTIDKNKIIVGTKTNKLKAWTVPEKFLKEQ